MKTAYLAWGILWIAWTQCSAVGRDNVPADTVSGAEAQISSGRAFPAKSVPEFSIRFKSIRTEAERADPRTRATASQPDRSVSPGNLERVLADAVKLARAEAWDPNSLGVLTWLLSEYPKSRSANRAARVLLARHRHDPAALKVAEQFAWMPIAWPTRVLRAIADDKQLTQTARARALYSLACGFQSQRDYREDRQLEARATQAFRELAATYPKLSHRGKPWPEIASAHLFEIEHLTLGKVAPNIHGEDLNGDHFSLHSYRGQVVLLDFWGDWCGPCREIYEHGPRLLKQYAGRPFAIVGVNSDEDRTILRRRVREVGVTWRVFWDGGKIGGPIATRWNVEGWPALYLIDHQGVIRSKYLRGESLDRAIETWVRQAERANHTAAQSR